MDSKTLWTVVIVAVVASLITAFVTVNLTGNAIFGTKEKVTKGFDPLRDYYKKAEVDALLKSLNLDDIKLKSLLSGTPNMKLNYQGLLLEDDNANTSINLDEVSNNYVDGIGSTQFRLMDDKLNLQKMSIISLYDNQTIIDSNGITFVVNQFKWSGPKQDFIKYAFKCAPDVTGQFKCVKVSGLNRDIWP